MTDISTLIDEQSFETGGQNTMIRYLYRDGSNYKLSEEVILEGSLTISQAQEVVEHLARDMGEDQFIPSAVGLEDLQGRMPDGWSSDDHPYHELQSIYLTDQNTTSHVPVEKFYTSSMTADWPAAAKIVCETTV